MYGLIYIIIYIIKHIMYFSKKKIQIYKDTFAIVCAKYKDVYPDKFSSLKTKGKFRKKWILRDTSQSF